MKAQMVAMAPLIAWKLTGSLLSKRVFFQILPHHVSSETSFHWPRCTPGITFCRQIMIPLSIISVTFKHLKHCNRTIVHYCCKCSPKKKTSFAIMCNSSSTFWPLIKPKHIATIHQASYRRPTDITSLRGRPAAFALRKMACAKSSKGTQLSSSNRTCHGSHGNLATLTTCAYANFIQRSFLFNMCIGSSMCAINLFFYFSHK